MPSLNAGSPSTPPSPVHVFFPCTGLGRQRRGFETFTLECADALRDDPRLRLSVFSGGDIKSIPARTLWNLPRNSWGASMLAELHGRGPYFSEQLSFFLALLPHLVREKPDVIYFADLNLGNLCWHWRRRTGQQFNLLYYNGGLTTKPFTRADLIQQLTPQGLAEATARGEGAGRQVVLPHGVRIPAAVPERIAGTDRVALGLPADRPVVLSVGLLDMTIKRMDYLIREVASLPTPRPFLCLLGAECDETAAVRQLATELLGENGSRIRTVATSEVGQYYRAADVFVLSSLREGFGLAYVEALAHGLSIVAHDFDVPRYVLGDLARLVDLSMPTQAARAIESSLAESVSEATRSLRHSSARARFGWDSLHEQYVSMLLRAATMRKGAA